jgi:hypothetical protein
MRCCTSVQLRVSIAPALRAPGRRYVLAGVGDKRIR